MYARLLGAPLLVLAALQCGCSTQSSSSTPEWDRQFGARTRATLALQRVSPAAVSNAGPDSMDGRAARSAYQRYQKAAGEAGQPSPALPSQSAGNN